MGILRLNDDQRKRKELTFIVRQTIKKGDKEKFKLDWASDMLYGQLSVGNLAIRKTNEYVLSISTLNKGDITPTDLSGFDAVDVSVMKGDQKAKAMAYRICAGFEEKGYHTQLRETK